VINGHHGSKEAGGVAVLTNISRLDVCGDLADSVDTIVTADAVVADIGMVEKCRHPAIGLMTVVALLA